MVKFNIILNVRPILRKDFKKMRQAPKVDNEKRKQGRDEKNALRASKISQAISNHVPTNTITTPLSSTERETIIILNSDNTATIDTTIPRDLNRCLDRDYTLASITLYNSRPVGASFSIPAKKISFRS